MSIAARDWRAPTKTSEAQFAVSMSATFDTPVTGYPRW